MTTTQEQLDDIVASFDSTRRWDEIERGLDEIDQAIGCMVDVFVDEGCKNDPAVKDAYAQLNNLRELLLEVFDEVA